MSKRSADANAPVLSNKKVKFADQRNQVRTIPREDEFGFDNDADFEAEIENSLEKRRGKRGKVKMEGYGSDEDVGDHGSDDDEEKSGRKDADADDMFADYQEKKFEGEVDLAAGETFYILKEEDGVEKEIPIIAFNMKNERQEGKFNDEDQFIENEDEERQHDNWLAGISLRETRKAAEAHANREASLRISQKDDDLTHISLEKALLQILDLLQPDESIYRAFRRLAPPKMPRVRRFKSDMKVDSGDAPREKSAEVEAIEKLTSLADSLMARGFLEIYEQTREELQIKLDTLLEKSKGPLEAWRYKWTEDGDIHGNFSTDQMKQWKLAGLFAAGLFIQRGVVLSDGSFRPNTPFEVLTGQV